MRTHAWASVFLCCGLVVGCGETAIEPDRTARVVTPSASAPTETTVPQKAPVVTGTGSRCTRNALEKSKCMIDAVLGDVMATYTQVGGGGITEIKLVATNKYTVSISQEERIDLITYDLEVKSDGRVVIAKRAVGTESFRH